VENHISLIENLITDAEATPEAIFAKYFYSEKQDSVVIVPSPNESSTVESEQEKTDNEKIVQFPNLKPSGLISSPTSSGLSVKLEDIVEQYWDDSLYGKHVCGVCGYEKLTSMKAKTCRGEEIWLCNDCHNDFQRQREAEA
jgi:hypothetical protein